jgi:hypothetical protein
MDGNHQPCKSEDKDLKIVILDRSNDSTNYKKEQQ